ncbi:DUF4262 domain-containing protein [Nostoc sp. CHAB 5834]|nr:DUF4262 domain-containing protein [Nostoc sp. CHAB 5834]
MDKRTEIIAKVMALLDKHEWIVQGVLGNPPHTYTVGLSHRFNLPEIVLIGIHYETARHILNQVAGLLKSGEIELNEDTSYDCIFQGLPARFRKMPEVVVPDVLRMATVVPSKNALTAWQLLWPTVDGLFPSDLPDTHPASIAQNYLSVTSTDGMPS